MPELQFKSITSDPDWTQITVDGPFNLGVMEVQFKTLKNNKPNAYKNYLAIWEGSGNLVYLDTHSTHYILKLDHHLGKLSVSNPAYLHKLMGTG